MKDVANFVYKSVTIDNVVGSFFPVWTETARVAKGYGSFTFLRSSECVDKLFFCVSVSLVCGRGGLWVVTLPH